QIGQRPHAVARIVSAVDQVINQTCEDQHDDEQSHQARHTPPEAQEQLAAAQTGQLLLNRAWNHVQLKSANFRTTHSAVITSTNSSIKSGLRSMLSRQA